MFTIIQWAPFFKQEDKPKRASDIFKLKMDSNPIIKQKTTKKTGITEREIKVMEALGFNKK